MDIITNLCFNNKNDLPDNEVIEIIIENIMPFTKHEIEKTEILLDFNLNKSIKSTLFQLLLNYRKEKVHQHLDNILSKSENYLRDNYNSEDLTDLKIMFINSIENNFYARQTFNESDSELNDAKEFLDKLIQETDLLESNKNGYSKRIIGLERIAKIKFVLTKFCKLLADPESITDNKIYIEFNKMVQIFIENQDSMWPRFFLIKYAFRKYGQNVYW